MRKFLPAALAAAAFLMFPVQRVLAESSHGGGGSHGGGSHGSGSHGGGSHGGGTRGGGSPGGGFHGRDGSHDGSSRSSGSHGGGSHGGFHGSGSEHGRGGHDGDGRHRGGGHRGGGWIIYPGGYWGGWGWDCPFDYGCYGYWPGYGPWYGPGRGPEYAPIPEEDRQEWAIVDIEISPDLMRVYLDGRYIGLASDFDGEPDYLHLRPGSYKLEFQLEGYESWSLDIQAEPGSKIEVNKKLHRSGGTESYRPAEPPQPEEDVRHFWGRNERGEVEPEQNDRRMAQDEQDPDDADADANADEDEPPASSTARLQLSIKPPDAVVYIDGHFLGTAAEVSDAPRGVPLTPGKHAISVLRPGSKDRIEEVDVREGETKKLDISLP